jgi:hypothetical protein
LAGEIEEKTCLSAILSTTKTHMLPRREPGPFLQVYCDDFGSSDCNKIAAKLASAEAILLACILEVVGRRTSCSGVCPV